jgi:hypothetical protein
MSTVQRIIYFYKVEAKKNGKIITNLANIFGYINSLSFSLNGRIRKLIDRNDHICMILHSTKYPIKGLLGVIRKEALPVVFKESTGNTKGLAISSDEGLYDPIHFIIFKLENRDKTLMTNILGAEFNYYGPRPSRISWYVRGVTPQLIDEIKLLPIIRGDVEELLNKFSEIKWVKLSVNMHAAQALKDYDTTLFSGLDFISRFSGARDIELVLKPQYRKKKGSLALTIDKIKELIKRKDAQEALNQFKLKALSTETGEYEIIDLLNEFILSRKQVAKISDVYRNVDSDSMFEAINSAYYEQKTEIEKAIFGEG